MNYTLLAQCPGAVPFPFCTFVNNRPANVWDPITLDTMQWAGMMGHLRFTYNSQDSCCTFERGWFIDNANIAPRCPDM
jgi:hypothetical protein